LAKKPLFFYNIGYAALAVKHNFFVENSKRDVANLLHEEAETRSVRECLWKKQQQQTQQSRRKPNATDRIGKFLARVHFERCASAFWFYA